MKRLVGTLGILVVTLCLVFTATAVDGPYLVSDALDSLSDDAVFVLIINDVEQNERYPATNKRVEISVANWPGGATKIQAMFGEPWVGISGAYRWSDPSAPLNYPFPMKPGSATGMEIVGQL